MDAVSATEARRTLPHLLDRVESGDEVEIARHGRVVAVMVNPAALATRRAHHVWEKADEIGAMLEAARSRPLRRAALGADRADELVAEVRRGRDTR